MILFVYFFNSDHIVSYGILGLLIILIINCGIISDQINSFFFNIKSRNKWIVDTDIKNQFFVDEEMTKTKLMDEKDKIEEKNTLYNIKKRGILGRYNQFKQRSAKTLDKFEYFADMFEKIKNLLTWKDELMTKYFFVFLLLIYVFFTFLPVRYITIIYLIRRFHKGKSYYKRRKISNKEVANVELTKFLAGFDVDITKTKEWPKKVKHLETKLIAHFQTNLKIYLPAKIIETKKTFEEFLDYVSEVDAVLRLIENDENDRYLENDTDKKIMSLRKPAYKYFLNFIMNFIPSDFYRESVQEEFNQHLRSFKIE